MANVLHKSCVLRLYFGVLGSELFVVDHHTNLFSEHSRKLAPSHILLLVRLGIHQALADHWVLEAQSQHCRDHLVRPQQLLVL
jgi:hypothetical protein